MISSSHTAQGADDSYKFVPLRKAQVQVAFHSLLEGASQTAATGRKTTDPLAGNKDFLQGLNLTNSSTVRVRGTHFTQISWTKILYLEG